MRVAIARLGANGWSKLVLVTTAAARITILGYQYLISPMLGPRCRFWPSCSNYTLQAIELHGAWAGTRLGARRLARCHPWCAGGVDPVPPRAWPNALRDRS